MQITHKGSPYPLGATPQRNGVNFALFSRHATKVTLGLFASGKSTPQAEFILDPFQNKTGFIWHISIENCPLPCFYAYKIAGPSGKGNCFHPEKWMLDPYAKELSTTSTWGDKQEQLVGKVMIAPPFDWENDQPPNIPCEELLIYEMHVRGFTKDPSSQTKNPGTFLGLIEKIPFLKSLNINVIELLPIFEFDETANPFKNPKTGQPLFNYWGYSTMNFFAPMARYATAQGQAIHEFKTMVKELHKAGIEVILDIVLNHTGEGTAEKGPCFSFRGIDNSIYYLLDEEGKDSNYSGCGNTVNCTHPTVVQLILAVLRYWVQEMHVDGFRFDLASIFCRGKNGRVLKHPPVIEAIDKDPLLSKTRLIAEAWDCSGLYQVGSFPGGARWAEWNGKFRDVVRRFLKGTEGQVGDFARVITGSEDLYGNKRFPHHSINFVTCHDGFTLHDLVSYNGKHNEENGEGSRDGNNSNDSWNCGEEGPTKNPEILALRQRQMRNFIFTLSVAIGTPMFLMGDEYAHSRNGNNNTYCQDNQKNYFLWDQLKKQEDLHLFFQKMLEFRNRHPFLKRKVFLTEKDILWHGHSPHSPNWNADSRFIAYTLLGPKESQLYIAFNAHFQSATIQIPPSSQPWHRLVDTALPSSENFPSSPSLITNEYALQAHSCLLLETVSNL